MAFQIKTSKVLPFSTRQVWGVLTDFDNYPEWNPFITEASGDWTSGKTVTITAGGMRFKPEILAFEPNRKLRWRGKLLLPGIFDGEHYFKLTEQEDGRTLLEHGEYFSGVLTTVTKGMIYEKTKAGFEAMNEALADRLTELTAATRG